MTNKSRTIYLLWLPIALLCLVIPTKGQGNAYHVYARDALAHEIASLKAEYGDAVDVSPQGYDHKLVAPSLKDAGRKRSTAPMQVEIAIEATEVKAQYGGGTQKIDLSLDGYDLGDLEDYEEGEEVDEDEETGTPSTRHKRSLSAVQASLSPEASSVKAELQNQVDLSLDGYDLDTLADDEDNDQDKDNVDDDEILETRDTGSADSDDILGHIHSRSTSLKNYEPVPNEAEFGADVDFSLDGYEVDDIQDEDDDTATPSLARRGDDEENDDDDDDEKSGAIPIEDLSIPALDKASFPPGVDFSLDGYDSEELLRRDLDTVENDDDADDDQYLISWDDAVRKRDFPEDSDDENDRYHDATEVLGDGTVAAADGAGDETSEDEGQSWYVGVKRWFSGSEQ